MNQCAKIFPSTNFKLQIELSVEILHFVNANINIKANINTFLEYISHFSMFPEDLVTCTFLTRVRVCSEFISSNHDRSDLIQT